MKVTLCEKRQAILKQDGHLLVLGGPGSGKTTIALLKAQARSRDLQPGQEILFLSFSRAAVRQIVARCKEILSRDERRVIQVKTYHSFCLETLASHGRLLGGRDIRFLFPGDERLRKSLHNGDWEVERQRLAKEEGLYCFDLFAAGVASVLESRRALRALYGDKYPMVIVDEFQDTDDDQWRLVRTLTLVTHVFCLADPEQRIFEYRPNVDPKRLDALREYLNPAEFDLAGENHRSPSGSVLKFADAILLNRGPLPRGGDVKNAHYYPNGFESAVHGSVVWMFTALRTRGVTDPCVAVLCRSNSFIAKLSAILSEPHVYNSRQLPPLDHDVVWDADLSASAAAIVGLILEWPTGAVQDMAVRTLRGIANYYRLKNAEHPSSTAADAARRYEEAAQAVVAGRQPRIRAGKELIAACAAGLTLIGDPVEDWKRARLPLLAIAALDEIVRAARLVRLFRATDALARGLADRWLETGSYRGAADLIRRILNRERLIGADRDPTGCVLMTIHKSKGKEFDGVVLVEGQFESPFFDTKREQPPYEWSRRLLRVGVTRARSLVTIVRPHGAAPLVDS